MLERTIQSISFSLIISCMSFSSHYVIHCFFPLSLKKKILSLSPMIPKLAVLLI